MTISGEGDRESEDKEDREDDTLIRRPCMPVQGVKFPTERINSEYTMSSGKTYCFSLVFRGRGGVTSASGH
ncbi:hypothetical protein M378DRAFT_171336 [Amanita muscaria Koide BX008]|uniref:Uncharacterized protein n=1 Tax=Amanita muscaria (strain Koide BX008) TaxID=946122 RepID=A0A0C2W9D5_AMAMK|nr:hypothetical protein M378DRAFT_171336 [Amanita muscaria Koide BX008]